MTTKQETSSVENVFDPIHKKGANLVYLLDKDPEALVQKYASIPTEKVIIAAYSINGRHCLVVSIAGVVKKVRKRKKNKQE